MPHAEQTYANHHRYDPKYHFFAAPIVAINIIVRVVYLFRWPGLGTAWDVAVAVALGIVTLVARTYALRAQDRVIRLEETMRLTRLLPDDLRPRIGELRPSQLIALRFCSDAELPEMTRAVLADARKSGKEIKQEVRSWRADWLRV